MDFLQPGVTKETISLTGTETKVIEGVKYIKTVLDDTDRQFNQQRQSTEKNNEKELKQNRYSSKDTVWVKVHCVRAAIVATVTL